MCALDLGQRKPCGWCYGGRPQSTLEPHDIMPRAKLKADGMINPNRAKSDAHVKPAARFVWQRDAGERRTISLSRESVEQFHVELARDALTARLRRNVDADVDRPLIRSSGSVRRRISVTADVSSIRKHQPRIGIACANNPPSHLVGSRWTFLKRDKRIGDDRIINCR